MSEDTSKEDLENDVDAAEPVKEETSETQAEEAAETEAAEQAAAVEPELSKEEESYKIQYLRLRADFENFRKRTRREKEEWTQRCLENLCTDLLTVLDHFDLGLENSKGKELTEDTLKGFEIVRGQLDNTLGKYGLSQVVIEEGAFDPNLHEAITHMPSTEVAEGEVVAMTRKGYQLGNRLLRPAQVVVSAGSGETETVPTEEG